MNKIVATIGRIAFACVGSMSASGASAREVQIADGDSAALLAAIADARTSVEPTDIVLAEDGTYALPPEELHFGGTTTIDGNGAVLESLYTQANDNDDRGTLLVVDQGAVVTIKNASFTGHFQGSPWLKSSGQLFLAGVSIHGEMRLDYITLYLSSWAGGGKLIAVSGVDAKLKMRNVTLDLTVLPPPDEFITQASFWYSIIDVRDGATADLQHVTLRALQTFTGGDTYIIGVVGVTAGDADQSTPAPQVTISNSILYVEARAAEGAEATVGGWPCVRSDPNSIVSNGGNLVSEPSCGFGRTVADAGFGSFDDHGGSVPTLSLRGVSPAIDAGEHAYCLATDARGYQRGAACDSGAFEFGAARAGGGLLDMGAGGYWNEPGEQGFLAVSFPGTERILLVWSTYDTAGKAATVYGVGHFVDADTIVVADAATDLPIAGTTPVRVKPVRWGELRFDIESCSRAQFSYQTDMPGFASGEKGLSRLTNFSSVGCSELVN